MAYYLPDGKRCLQVLRGHCVKAPNETAKIIFMFSLQEDYKSLYTCFSKKKLSAKGHFVHGQKLSWCKSSQFAKVC